jgi:hypothetical protein
MAQLVKLLEHVPALGPKMTVLPDYAQQSAIAVVFGLKEPGAVVERITPWGEEEGLNGRRVLTGGLTRAPWQPGAAGGPPHEEVLSG